MGQRHRAYLDQCEPQDDIILMSEKTEVAVSQIKNLQSENKELERSIKEHLDALSEKYYITVSDLRLSTLVCNKIDGGSGKVIYTVTAKSNFKFFQALKHPVG